MFRFERRADKLTVVFILNCGDVHETRLRCPENVPLALHAWMRKQHCAVPYCLRVVQRDDYGSTNALYSTVEYSFVLLVWLWQSGKAVTFR